MIDLNINTEKTLLCISPISEEIEEEIKDNGSVEGLLTTLDSLYDLLDETRYLGNGYETLDASVFSRYLNPYCEVIGYDGRAYYLPDSACRDIVSDLLIKREALNFQLLGEYGSDDDGEYYVIGEKYSAKEILPIIPREVSHPDFGSWVELFLPTQIDRYQYKEYCDCVYYEAGGYHYTSSSIDFLLEGKVLASATKEVKDLLNFVTHEYWADETNLEYKILFDTTPRLLKKWEQYRFWNLYRIQH